MLGLGLGLGSGLMVYTLLMVMSGCVWGCEIDSAREQAHPTSAPFPGTYLSPVYLAPGL